MLYQLVTGRRPHDLSGRSIPEAIRIITEVDPPRASLFRREAAGDLDAILATAMDKDRERRYSSAAALAGDVRRFLANLPIEARPASTLVQLQKFVRRNRPLTIASLAALSLLILGTAVSIRLAVVEKQARRAAELRERELESVTEFQESLLRDIDVADMGDRLRLSLMESVERASPSEPEGEREQASGDELQRLIGPVNFTSLAVRALNESVLQRHLESIQTKFADRPAFQARLLQQLARTMNTLGLYAEAEPVLRDALAIRSAELGRDHADTLLTLHSLGSLLVTLGRQAEAEIVLREAYDRRTRRFGEDDPMTLRTGTSLGGALRRLGELPEAERVWSDTLRNQRRVLGEDHPETLRSLNNMGVIFATQGRMDEAEASWRELLAHRRALGEDQPDYRSTLGNLCALLQERGKLNEAGALKPEIERALATARQRFGDMHTDTLMTMGQLALLLQETGDEVAAEVLQRECLAGRQSTLGPDSPQTLLAMTALATNLFAQGELTEAEPLVCAALESQRRVFGTKHPDTIESLGLLSRIAHKVGRHDEAIALSTEAIEQARLALPPSHWTLGQLLSDHGKMLLDAGDKDQAREFLLEGYHLLQAALGEQHPRTREAAEYLAKKRRQSGA